MIISVHLPKTAGSSFSLSLEKIFAEKLLKDYQDYPINTEPYQRNLSALQASIKNSDHSFNDVLCIHGHFLPLKYLLLSVKQDLTFITWMRHPVERLLSHYYFWQRSYDANTAPPLHKKVIEENWTKERFCLGPELRNLYAQFLWGFPLELFSFIGITEYYREDLIFFSKEILKQELEYHEVNTGATRTNQYEIDKTFYSKIELHHSLDMALYQRALKFRSSRPPYG